MFDLENLTDADFEKVRSWGLDIDPFAAVKDFSFLSFNTFADILFSSEHLNKKFHIP